MKNTYLGESGLDNAKTPSTPIVIERLLPHFKKKHTDLLDACCLAMEHQISSENGNWKEITCSNGMKVKWPVRKNYRPIVFKIETKC